MATITDPSFDFPIDVAVDHWRHEVFVANNGATGAGTTVTVLDGTTNTVQRVLSGFDGPFGMAVSAGPLGARLLVANDNASDATMVYLVFPGRAAAPPADGG